MITACPICGGEEGVTHGDQIWTSEVCPECIQVFGEEACAREVTKIHQQQLDRYIENQEENHVTL